MNESSATVGSFTCYGGSSLGGHLPKLPTGWVAVESPRPNQYEHADGFLFWRPELGHWALTHWSADPKRKAPAWVKAACPDADQVADAPPFKWAATLLVKPPDSARPWRP